MWATSVCVSFKKNLNFKSSGSELLILVPLTVVSFTNAGFLNFHSVLPVYVFCQAMWVKKSTMSAALVWRMFVIGENKNHIKI